MTIAKTFADIELITIFSSGPFHCSLSRARNHSLRAHRMARWRRKGFNSTRNVTSLEEKIKKKKKSVRWVFFCHHWQWCENERRSNEWRMKQISRVSLHLKPRELLDSAGFIHRCTISEFARLCPFFVSASFANSSRLSNRAPSAIFDWRKEINAKRKRRMEGGGEEKSTDFNMGFDRSGGRWSA